SREGLRRDQDPPPIDAFAVTDDKGEEVLYGVRRQLSIWRRGHGVVACTCDREIHALVRAPGGELVCVAREGERLAVVRARLDGDRLVLGKRVELGEAPRIAPVHGFFPKWLEDRKGDDEVEGFEPA